MWTATRSWSSDIVRARSLGELAKQLLKCTAGFVQSCSNDELKSALAQRGWTVRQEEVN